MSKLTYADVLLGLPLDTTLKIFLTREGLSLPDDFAWTDEVSTSRRLLEYLQHCQDRRVRDRLMAGLQSVRHLAHEGGRQAMFQAACRDGAVLSGLVRCQGDLHQAFWLFVHHPAIFEQAMEMDYADRHAEQAQQHDVGLRAPVCHDPQALSALCDDIKAFYQKEMGGGEVCVAHLLDRPVGTQLLTLHAKDLATARLEFEGTALQRRIGSPNIPMALEYSPATGVTRTLIRGGAKYHTMLVKAFCRHLLGQEPNVRRLQPALLDLSSLQTGFQVPEAVEEGFIALQIKSITLLNPGATLKTEFTAMANHTKGCVTALIAEHFPSDNPLAQKWQVNAATLHLYYAPAPGKQRSPVVTIEVTRRGRLNLHKYDDKLRMQLEKYLVTLGILKSHQSLTPVVVNPEYCTPSVGEFTA